MAFVILLLAGLIVATVGYLGSRWIVRRGGGVPALAVLIPWLFLPYVVIAVLAGGPTEPVDPAEPVQPTFAFEIFVILFSIPWLPANIIGALRGRKSRARVNRPEEGQ